MQSAIEGLIKFHILHLQYSILKGLLLLLLIMMIQEENEIRDRRRKRPFSTPFCTHFPFFCLLTWESNTVRLSICEKYCLSIKGWAPCLQGTRSWRPSAIRTPAPALLVRRGDYPRLPLTMWLQLKKLLDGGTVPARGLMEGDDAGNSHLIMFM